MFDYWNKLFQDTELRNYQIQNIARILEEKKVFRQFQCWTGTGSNGKSAFVRLIESMFGSYAIKSPKSIITGYQKSNGPTQK